MDTVSSLTSLGTNSEKPRHGPYELSFVRLLKASLYDISPALLIYSKRLLPLISQFRAVISRIVTLVIGTIGKIGAVVAIGLNADPALRRQWHLGRRNRARRIERLSKPALPSGQMMSQCGRRGRSSLMAPMITSGMKVTMTLIACHQLYMNRARPTSWQLP